MERALPQPPQWEDLDDETMRLAFEQLSDQDLAILLTAAEAESGRNQPQLRELPSGEVAARIAFANAVAEVRRGNCG